MAHLGIGVMLGMLFGNDETSQVLQAQIGKKITGLSLKDDKLYISFNDNQTIQIFDDGQSCCENRYMMTGDNLDGFVGVEFTGAELRDAPDAPIEYGEHEVKFLLIHTSLGTFTMETHNEHNGYYGGFYVIARFCEPSQ